MQNIFKNGLSGGLFLIGIQTSLCAAIPPPPASILPDNPVPTNIVLQDELPGFVPSINPAIDTMATPETGIDLPSQRATGDATSNNTPGIEWYKDMHRQLYQLQSYTEKVKEQRYSVDIDYYADWLSKVIDSLYQSTYDEYGNPKQYAWGFATRGDFNHVFYYWIRPLYKHLLDAGAQYWVSSNPYYHKAYQDRVKPVYDSYHALTRCMYGWNGADESAEDDTGIASLEQAAGFL